MKTFVVLFFFPALAFAQQDSTDIIVKQLMDQQKIVGMSLAVVKNGKPVVNKGYGLADVELNVPLTSESALRLGSVSKQFFATAIFKLMEEGKLTIEDPVHKFFPDAPESWREIKIKHLLSHTSGLQRESPGYDISRVQPDIAVIRAAYSLALDFRTGEKYQYSNLAYFILSEIIKQVSGMPWQDYIREKLFLPAGMRSSQLADFYSIIPNRSSGYRHRHDTLVNAIVMYGVRPSGGFISTASDMIKWDKAISEEKIILKKENWEKLWQPFIKVSDDKNSKHYYGFGWEIGERTGHKTVGHGGSTPGFKSAYIRFVNDDLSVIVLTNTDEADPIAIALKVADYFLRKSK